MTRRFLSSILSGLAAVFLSGFLPSLEASDASAPVHVVDGSHAREWLVLAPILSKEMEIDFLAEAGGEANVRPKEGETVTTSNGQRLTWTRLRSLHPRVSFDGSADVRSGAIAYAYCELQSESGGESHALTTASESASVRLNGEPIGSVSHQLEFRPDLEPLLPLPLKAGRNACLLKIKGARVDWGFLFQPLPPARSIVEVQVVDEAQRQISGGAVQFYVGGHLASRRTIDDSGKAVACFYPAAESYDVRITSGNLGAWLLDLKLQPGERRRLEVTLTNAVAISGQVLALDRSPQSAIVVQAIPQSAPSGDSARWAERPSGSTNRVASRLPLPPFSETVLSDTNGHFRFVNLRPGQYQLRAHGRDGFVFPVANKRNDATEATVAVEPGKARDGVVFVLPEVKKGVWRNLSITVGLREAHPTTIHRAADGRIWVGTDESFVQAYDGAEFRTMASSPEVPANEIEALEQGADGAVWIGTHGGAARHVEGRTETLSFGETLTRQPVTDFLAEADGTVWIATGSGLVRVKGSTWTAFTTREGLPGNNVHSLCRARDGALWLATTQGLVRYDGQNFLWIESPYELFQGTVVRIHQARDEAIWFTTLRGVYRYDGRALSRVGQADGLLSDRVFDVAETSDGILWFATDRGLSRFDGTTIVNYTMADGLSNDWVRRIVADPDDVLWCANGWGVSRFDPKVFTGFTNRDGLQSGSGETAGVLTIEPDPNGGAWIGTAWGGVSFGSMGTSSKSLFRIPSGPLMCVEFTARAMAHCGWESIRGALQSTRGIGSSRC